MSLSHPSSRDLAEELILLKEAINAFVYGEDGRGPSSLSKGGCATATFGSDRFDLFDAARRMRDSMGRIMASQPALPPPSAQQRQPSHQDNSPKRVALSPTRREQLPTNSAVFLNASHSPSDSHKVRNDGAVLVPTRGGSPARKSPQRQQRSAETLSDIARAYGVSVSELRFANPNLAAFNDEECLPVHSPVRVPSHRGGAHHPASPSFTDVGGQSVADTPFRAFSGGGGASPQAPTPFHSSAAQAPAPYNAPVDRALESSLFSAPPMLPSALHMSPARGAAQSPSAMSAGSVGRRPSPNNNNSITQSEGGLRQQYQQNNQVQTSDRDSIWSLAKEYDVPVRDLLRANPQLRVFGVNEPLPPHTLVGVPLAGQ